MQHKRGPKCPEAYAALKHQDECIGGIWRELQKDDAGRATLLLVSDHGFEPYRQQILPNVLLRREGLLTALGGKVTGGRVRAVAQGGSCYLYVRNAADKADLVPKLAEMFSKVEGVGQVLTPKDFAAQGLPDPAQSPFMGDLVLSAKPGYGFGDLAAGDNVMAPPYAEPKGTHGNDAALPGMQAAFVAWGAGIKAGARLGQIKNTSVAPTMAALLGLTMTGTDGTVLDLK